MIRKTDANTVLVETNGYDAGGRLTKHWTPAKGLTQYGYDNNGNTLTRTDARNITANFTYDQLNRVTKLRYTNDPQSTPGVEAQL